MRYHAHAKSLNYTLAPVESHYLGIIALASMLWLCNNCLMQKIIPSCVAHSTWSNLVHYIMLSVH